jgi:hypothetical protein
MKRACYFLIQNFAEEAELNDSTVSSEEFPLVAANLFDPYKRSKKWRSAGYFEIPDSEKSIVVNEGGGNITVSLTTLEFSSRAAFLAHVQQKLNDSVSTALTYTLSIDATTKKTRISASGNFSVISTHADSDLCDFLGISRLVNLSGDDEYLADSIIIHTEESIVFDLGVDANPKAFILIGDRKDGLNLTENAIVKIQGNHFDSWASPAYEEELTVGKSISLVREDGLDTSAYRFWRLLITDKANPYGYIEANKLYLGDAYSPARGAPRFPFGSEIENRSQFDQSEYGERFSVTRRNSEKFSLDWDNLTYEEKEKIVSIYEEFGNSQPLFMIFDGNGAFASSPSFYARYVYFDSQPRPSLTSPGLWGTPISFAEVP